MAHVPVHRQVQDLLLRGAAPEDVQDLLGLTPSAYSTAVASITRRSVDAAYAAQVLELELARLDKLQSTYWEAAVSGAYEALAAVLSIMKRRASYLGLDAPTQTQTNTSSFVDVLASLSTHPAAKTITIDEQQPTEPHSVN